MCIYQVASSTANDNVHGLLPFAIQELFGFSTQRWSTMYFALEELLVVRSGLLCVRRKQLERAIMEQ